LKGRDPHNGSLLRQLAFSSLADVKIAIALALIDMQMVAVFRITARTKDR